MVIWFSKDLHCSGALFSDSKSSDNKNNPFADHPIEMHWLIKAFIHISVQGLFCASRLSFNSLRMCYWFYLSHRLLCSIARSYQEPFISTLSLREISSSRDTVSRRSALLPIHSDEVQWYRYCNLSNNQMVA